MTSGYRVMLVINAFRTHPLIGRAVRYRSVGEVARCGQVPEAM
jgi:hypothetical protein